MISLLQGIREVKRTQSLITTKAEADGSIDRGHGAAHHTTKQYKQGTYLTAFQS